MESKDEIVPVEVYSGTPWDAGIVKSLLENAEIEAFLKDAIMGTLGPWWVSPGGAGAVKVFVSSEDLDKAKLIVEEFEKNIKNNL